MVFFCLSPARRRKRHPAEGGQTQFAFELVGKERSFLYDFFVGRRRAKVETSLATRFREMTSRAVLASLPVLFLFAGVASAADLAPGAKAPAFELLGSDGKLHSLAMHRGKRGVVLAWFPKAFTPG